MNLSVAYLLKVLILAVVLIVICIVAKWFVDYMQVPHPINWLITLVIGLICLLIFLDQVGLFRGLDKLGALRMLHGST